MTLRELFDLLPSPGGVGMKGGTREVVVFDRGQEDFRKLVGLYVPVDETEAVQLVVEGDE